MIHIIDEYNLTEYVLKYDRIIWFMFFEGQDTRSLAIRPNSDLLNEVLTEFPNVTFFKTNLTHNPKIIEHFKLTDKFIWDYDENRFNPRIITIKDGKKIYDQSGTECYCLETLLKMIFDLYPELIPVPPSE